MKYMPAKLRSTDGDRKYHPFQADIRFQIRQACVVGILEDRLQDFPSDKKRQYKTPAFTCGTASLSRQRCHYMMHNVDQASS